MSNDPRPDRERPGRRYETTFTPYGAEELLTLVKQCRETSRQYMRAVHSGDVRKASELAAVDEAALREVALWIYERVQRNDGPSTGADVTVLAEVDS